MICGILCLVWYCHCLSTLMWCCRTLWLWGYFLSAEMCEIIVIRNFFMVFFIWKEITPIPAGPNLLTHIILLIELCMFFIAFCYKIFGECWDFVGEQYKLWRVSCNSNRAEQKVVLNLYIATTVVSWMLLSWLLQKNRARKEKNKGVVLHIIPIKVLFLISYLLKSHWVQKKFHPSIPEFFIISGEMLSSTGWAKGI